MRQIKSSEIAKEFLACPYCGSEVNDSMFGCCGESSDHFETAYELVDGEMVLEHEVNIIDDEAV